MLLKYAATFSPGFGPRLKLATASFRCENTLRSIKHIFVWQHQGTVSSSALKQLRDELLREVVALTPPGHRQRIRNEWQKGREGKSGVSGGKRRITVDEQDKETLEIIEGII